MADDAAINEEEAQYQYPEYGAGAAPPDPQADNSGAIPVDDAPSDNSGAAPVAAAPGGQEAIPTGGDDGLGKDSTGQPATGPNGPIGRSVKAIVSYLMGAGAAHPDVIDKAAAQADPQGSMSPGDRNIMAVHQAAEMDGPVAAWSLVQANRVAYNAKQSFAFAALRGGQGKPPDINASIQAANQAGDHVLDGSSVQFAPSQGGVTATVMSPGSEQPQVYNLTQQQYATYLNVGKQGQWDRLMQDGIGGTLQKIAAMGNNATPDPRALNRQTQNPQGPAPAPSAPQPPKQTNFGNTPSTMNLSGNQDAIPESQQDKGTGYDQQLEARASKMFPWASQGTEREQWLAAQENQQDKLQNSVDVAKEKGTNDVMKARIAGGARVAATDRASQAREHVGDVTADARVRGSQMRADSAKTIQAMKAASEGNKQASAYIDSARKLIQTKMATGQPLDEEDKKVQALIQKNAQAPQVQRPQAPTPQAPAPQAPAQQPPVPGAKFYKGSWYTRGANGESVPVQQ